jgi:hypothetical protein
VILSIILAYLPISRCTNMPKIIASGKITCLPTWIFEIQKIGYQIFNIRTQTQCLS